MPGSMLTRVGGLVQLDNKVTYMEFFLLFFCHSASFLYVYEAKKEKPKEMST